MSAPRESLPASQSIRVVQGVFARTFKSLTWQRFGIFCLLVVVMALPDGIWPWLARRLGLERRT